MKIWLVQLFTDHLSGSNPSVPPHWRVWKTSLANWIQICIGGPTILSNLNLSENTSGKYIQKIQPENTARKYIHKIQPEKHPNLY